MSPAEETVYPLGDEEWQIIVQHDAYYRWLPYPAAQLTYVERDVDTGADAYWIADDPDGPVNISIREVVESKYPGFKMRRDTVYEPTVSTTQVRVEGIKQVDRDRTALGLSRRGTAANLIRHLEDGPWARHFPLDSITAIEITSDRESKVFSSAASRLRDHFLPEDYE